MIGWLYRILIGTFVSCKHVWEDKEKRTVQNAGETQTSGLNVYCKCKNCGKWKRFSMQN